MDNGLASIFQLQSLLLLMFFCEKKTKSSKCKAIRVRNVEWKCVFVRLSAKLVLYDSCLCEAIIIDVEFCILALLND